MGDKSKTYTGPNAAAKYAVDQEKREIAESAQRSEEQNRAYRASKRCFTARTELVRLLSDVLEKGNAATFDLQQVKITLSGAIGALTDGGETLERVASAPNGGAEKLRLDLQKAQDEIATLKQTVAFLEEQAMPDHHMR